MRDSTVLLVTFQNIPSIFEQMKDIDNSSASYSCGMQRYAVLAL
jgi:hypothetical protein